MMQATQRRGRIAAMFFAATLIWFCGAGPGAAGATDKPGCEGGARSIANFGLWQLRGKMNIDVWGQGEHPLRVIRFLSEPVVGAVDPEGPSYGKIKPGDVIVAIGGELITTEPAGFIFMTSPGGSPVELTLRRDGVKKNVTVVPTGICENDPRSFLSHLTEPVPPVYRRPIEPGELGEAPAPPAPPEPEDTKPPQTVDLPVLLMGIGLKCVMEGHSADNSLRFTQPPEVFRVAPGSAAEQAGVRAGDRLLRIDGIPMDTVAGMDRFRKMGLVQEIEWTILRDGETRTVMTKVGAPPGLTSCIEDRMKELIGPETPEQPVQYSGNLGTFFVEVRGAVPVNVTVDNEKEFVIIRTPDATIRVETVVKRRDEK